MKKFFRGILILFFLGSVFYLSTGFNSFKTYAIIVDNTDAPSGVGILKAVNVNTNEEYILPVENGGSTNFELPEGTYNFTACVYPKVAELYDVMIGGDLALKLYYTEGNCPF